MKVTVSTDLPCTLQDAIRHVMTPRLLQYVSHPIVHFKPINPSSFPDIWAPETYWVGLKLFGFLPFGKQAIVISLRESKDRFCMRDAGHSAFIPK